MKEWLIVFIKGILMGICDIIPGISGGTIAFITGIYQRLINAIKSFSPRTVLDLYNYIVKKDKGALKNLKKLDLFFLFSLFGGIVTAIFFGSYLVKFLLENYFVYTISFFVGLILASSIKIYKDIKVHGKLNFSFGIIGLTAGVLFGFLIPLQVEPSLIYIFMSGFIAINAMFLPGISGAFLLLILGVYEFMIDVLHNIFDRISYFIAFACGLLLGMMTISRVVSFFFRKDKPKTLYFLLGLVLGCLSIPIKSVILSEMAWSFSELSIAILSFFAGFSIVLGILKLASK